MRPAARFTQLQAVAFAIAALSSHAVAQSTKANDTTSMKKVKSNSDLITIDQLQSRTFSNAYTAIEALHSNWLRARNLNPPPGSVTNPGVAAAAAGTSSAAAQSASQAGSTGMPRDASGILVYYDGTRLGAIETLKTIPIANVYSIQRISGTDAQARFGVGHSDGVLFVSSGPNKGGK